MRALTAVLAAPLVLTFATLVGCASANDRLCEENAKCEGIDDPAKECADRRAECADDEECTASQEKCATESEALSQCVLDAESSCQDVGDASFYLPEDEDACGDQLEAFLECL